ncbi:hypothetical protein [Morganella morganii]|uniref:tail fiber/spike domain-containing protein n=1 Tax=Morganella morganii TaxID=582 RepID=UPI003EBF8EC6
MATIPTQNAVPSEAPRDLKFNSGKIDEFVTSLEHEYKDRFGRCHMTIEGMRWIFDQLMERFRVDINQAIIAAGYIPIDSFQKGAEITKRNEILRDETAGEYYRWDGGLPKSVPAGSTPESSGGVGIGKWVGVGDASLRRDLSVRSGASLVGTESGSNVQAELTGLSEKTNYLYGLVDFVKITDYSDLVEGDDWTNAIQAALDTGKSVYGNDTYKVSGKLKSKGQRLIGNWFINATHLHNTFSKVPASVELTEKNHIRVIYSSMAYDLCELLAMKSLGFNIINHYCNFNAHSSGRGGSVDILLDNAVTAGLYVCLNTEIAINETNLNITLEEYIDRYDGHPSVWGYSVYDEPGTRKISVADQDVKIEKMRKLTSKPLTCVDLVVTTCPPFYDHWSKNYDVFFVDSYAQHYESGTAQDKREWDKVKHRLDFGGVKAMSGCNLIIPVIGLFSGIDDNNYSKDKEQIVDSGLFFGTKGGGNYGVFIWDAPWGELNDDRVKNSKDYQVVCKKLSKQIISADRNITDTYIFGGFPGYHDYGVGQILSKLPIVDPAGKQSLGWSGSYLSTQWVDNKRYNGIGFKDIDSMLVTTINCRKNISFYIDSFHMNGINNGTKIQFISGIGVGSTRPISDEFDISLKKTFYGSSLYEEAVIGENLIISVKNNKGTENYDLIIRGLIICSDW